MYWVMNMNYKDSCRQRIQSRRGYSNYKDKNIFLKSLYSIVMLFLLVSTVVLGDLINKNNGFDTLLANLNSIIKPIQTFELGNWIPFENWFAQDNAVEVSVSSHYEELENQYFEALNNQVVSVDDGIVLYVASQATGELVLIKQDNGIIATYGSMNEIHVDEDDRILKGQILGLTEEVVYLDFNDNGNEISYMDALER